MKISVRLKTIADMVETKHVIDVGCDHALLDIYLASKDITSLAIDINESSISKALENVTDAKQQTKVELKVNDGLNNIKFDHNDTVVIAGLGTNTILDMVANRKINNLIIASNNDLDILRRELAKHGYMIKDEKVVLENDIYYVIIYFVIGYQNYTYFDYKIGPIIIQNKEKAYFNYLLTRDENVLNQLPTKYIKKRFDLKREINYLKSLL